MSGRPVGLSAVAAGLVAPDPRIGVPIPAYGGRSLPNIAASVVRATGGDARSAPALLPPLAPELDPFAGRSADGPVVVLLVDGLGWTAFDAWTRRPGAAARSVWGTRASPITTVFPTTTAPALVALATGTAPAQNGVVGYRQFLPRYGLVADLLKMAPVGIPHPESLVTPDWRPETISSAPPIFRRGVTGAIASRAAFEGSGLTRVLYDGAEYLPWATASEFAYVLAGAIGRPDPPRVLYAYWDELDTVHHRRGPADRTVDFEVDRLAHLLSHVAREVGPARARATTVLLTADHGQVPLDPARQVRVDRIPEIEAVSARPVAGDRRAGFFAARPGREAELEAALLRHLPAGTRVVRAAAAIDAGLFGPPPHHAELGVRVGDVIALVPPPAGIVSLPPGARPSGAVDFAGGHGGLTPEELLVPLVRGTLAELGAPADRPG